MFCTDAREPVSSRGDASAEAKRVPGARGTLTTPMSELELTARLARPDDYGTFARLVEELGTDDPVLPEDRWVAELMPITWIFERHGEVAGYIFAQTMNTTGYVRHLVVAPEHRGVGVGGAIMRFMARELRARGCDSWCLNVKPENTPAVRLYTRCGMRHRHDSLSLRMRWDAELPREGGVEARAVDAHEDALVEETFGLHSGQLASQRTRRGRRLIALWDGSECVGFACFDPHLGGAMPFSVKRVSLAGDLLDAMRSYAQPGGEFVRLVVEGDESLEALIRSAGGEALLAIAHMAGPIPHEST